MKITKRQLRRIIKEEISESVVSEVQKLIDGNQFLKGTTVSDADLIDSDSYVFYVSDDGLKHVKDRHLDENAPGSLFDSGVDLKDVIERLVNTSPTSTAGGKVKWEGVDAGGNIGKMGLAVADPGEVEKMKSYTMPGGRAEKVKLGPGDREPTSDVTLVSVSLGKLADGREALSLLTMFPGGMEVEGVKIPMDRNAFADAGIYFVLPASSSALKEGAMRITRRQLKRIIKEYGGRPYDPMEYPEGMNTRGYNPITGDIPQGYTEEDMYYDDYVSWAKKNGHVTPASSSVLATYVVNSGLDEPTWLSIASDVGIDALDVRMDIARQQAEQSVTMGESKTRITRRQLRRIIKEERLKLTEQAAVWSGGVIDPDALYEALFQILDQELDKMGVDRYGTPADAQNVADTLERIAGTIRSEGGVG
jgi:hypothetical protein